MSQTHGRAMIYSLRVSGRKFADPTDDIRGRTVVDREGQISATTEKVFTLTRIGAKYNPTATCPTFEKYLSDLFYPDDIPAIQEYIGYCLTPCTRAQSNLFINGQGGEGKSVLTTVLMKLFGHAAVKAKISDIGERFSDASFVNKLVMIDDDMKTELLNDTSALKERTTTLEKTLVERKGIQKYSVYLYERHIGIGNDFIGSKFDHSDGFYRRQLLITCKPKVRTDAENDPYITDKILEELEGVLHWSLAGLTRLRKNNLQFTVSNKMSNNLDYVKHDGMNALSFHRRYSISSRVG